MAHDSYFWIIYLVILNHILKSMKTKKIMTALKYSIETKLTSLNNAINA